MGKIQETRQLYKDVIEEIGQSEESWKSFLDSSAWNFKYDFDNQILIYAQRPDAKACASIEEWNKKLRRWVNRGTKPIYIFDKNPNSEYPFRLVFDLTDTHNYNNTEYKLWSIKKEYESEIIESLEANFGEVEAKESLAQVITLISYNMVTDNVEDYIKTAINYKSGSKLQGMNDDEIKQIFIITAWASISYMMMTRCEINAREYIQNQEFSYINYFNNQELLTILGTCVGDIAENGLREIAKTVSSLQKNEKLRNRTIEKIDKEIYANDNKNIKGGNENVRENQLHETRRLLYAEPNNGERENTSRQVRSDEIQLSEKLQETRINNISNEQETKQALDRDTRTSKQRSQTNSRADGEEKWSERGNENQRPNEMGRSNEQLQDDSRRDSSERDNLSVNDLENGTNLDENDEFLQWGKSRRKSDKAQLKDEYVRKILQNAYYKVPKKDIRNFFQLHPNIEERVEYLKKAFNDAFSEILIDNNKRVGYKTYGKVLHLWEGSYLKTISEIYYEWDEVAKYIEKLIQEQQFYDLHKPTPSYDDQMQILQVVANAPTFSFSQKEDDNKKENEEQKYEYHLGDVVYLGTDKYEIAGITNNIVTLYDPKFPLFNKQLEFSEFEKRVKDNYANEHLKVSNRKDDEVLAKKEITENNSIENETQNINHDLTTISNDKNKDKLTKKEKNGNKIQDFVLHPEISIENRKNYKILNENFGEGSPKEKFHKNIEAIKVLKKCEQENRYATQEEQDILAQYVGWGGLQQAFDESDKSWSNEYQELKKILTDEEYRKARESTLTAFYTPPIVVNAIYETLQKMGLKEANILEPSCGIGNFFGMLPDELEKCRMYGVELDEISGKIAQQLYQKSTIAVSGYEKTDLPDSFFDVVIGNVPFGDFKVEDKKYDKYKFQIHDYFFAKSLDKVRPRRCFGIYYIKRNYG